MFCLFVFVWTMKVFRESEKRESHTRKNIITFPKPDVNSGMLIPDADSADPDHTFENPCPRFNFVQKKLAIRFLGSKFPSLPSITENKEGEDNVAQIEELTSKLAKAKSELQQNQKTVLSLELRGNNLETEIKTLKKSLSEEAENVEQQRQQVSGLVEENHNLKEQLVEEKNQTNKTIDMLNIYNEIRVKKLRHEFARAEKSVPSTNDIGCGSDVAIASTQTESTTKDVDGCETAGLAPGAAQTRDQQVTTNESCGFELDFKNMDKCFSKHVLPFYIPAREPTKAREQTKSPVLAEPKLHFSAVGDVRYKNKPLSGYIVNPDGTMVTYGSALKSHTLPTQNPEIVGTPTPIYEKQKKTPRTTDGSVGMGGLIVTTSRVERKPLHSNKLLLTNIPADDYGRIIGRQGSNIQRIETEFKVAASLKESVDGNYSLLITGNTEEVRQAAANDVISGITITAEFCNLELFNRIKIKRQNDIGRKFYVRINRQSEGSDFNGKFVLTGKLSSCQSAYAALLAELNP